MRITEIITAIFPQTPTAARMRLASNETPPGTRHIRRASLTTSIAPSGAVWSVAGSTHATQILSTGGESYRQMTAESVAGALLFLRGLHVNGVLFLQRNWETATAPATVLTSPTTFQYRWTPIWQMSTAIGARVMMADWVYRMGRFLPDGRELFS